MTIDYDQLKTLVKEAMFTGGGINEPSAPEGIPIRMPAADTADKEQDMGDPKANELYSQAVNVREAVEELIEALDEPIFDGAYEFAFKASACMRRVLNEIEEAGAHPMPDERVVTPPAKQQKYAGSLPYAGTLDYGANGAAAGMVETDMSARSARISTASGVGGKQSIEDIDASLDAVVGAAGITTPVLKAALIKFLSELGLTSPDSVANKITMAVQHAKVNKEDGE